jgi:CSLREA domain-containing protein
MRNRISILRLAPIILLALAAAAPAANVTVNSLADAGGSCPGICTLRQAIITAGSGDTITFSLPAGSTITLTTAELLINKSVTISGPGASQLTVQRNTATGANRFRIFDIVSGVTVTMSGLTVSNGVLNGTANNHEGGGIFNAGTLTVANSTISGNTGTGLANNAGGGLSNAGTLTITNSTISGNFADNNASGGGIHNTGTLTVANSTISGNTANNSTPGGGGIMNEGPATITNSTISGNTVINSSGGKGAGIYNVSGSLTLTNCTVSGNNGDTGFGGGIENDGTLTVVNSTISGNAATLGAGVYNSGGGSATATLTNTTIAANSAKSAGGGIQSVGSTVTIKNTIIATNTATAGTGPDISGAVTSNGFNFVGNNANTGFTGGAQSNDQIGTSANPKNPNIGSLQDNGGPTRTHALLSGSTAIEGGNSGGTTTDQRGLPRPVDDPGITNASGGDGSDIGAYEVQWDQLPGCASLSHIVGNTNDAGTGSLRAIMANVCSGTTITFAPSVRGPINLTGGELLFNKSLTVTGPGANLLTIQRSSTAATNFRIFHNGNFNASISGLTIAKGFLPGNLGGGISNDNGTLVLDRVTVSGNTADIGAGIYTGRAATITNSTISGNTVSGNIAGDGGGAIYNQGGTLNLTNSTLSDNIARTAGGGGQGGGIRNNLGMVSITSTTIAVNSADQGGGVYSSSGTVTLQNSIIAQNVSGNGADLNGTFSSSGFNLIGNSTGGSISPAQFSDQIGNAGSPIDPLLGSLQDNGGPTFTRALSAGSAAIDKGNSNGATTDQRRYSRPVDLPNVSNVSGGDGGDIGAFEFGGIIPVTLANISTRLRVETGDNALIGGFIVTGSHDKRVIVLAIGPSLPFADDLADPTLELYQGNTLLESNDNWVDSVNRQAIMDSGVAPPNSVESAIIRTLPANNSQYTAIVRGAGGGTGIGSVQIYDLDRTTDSKLANISTRGLVQGGNDVMIAGFILSGVDQQKLIVRAIGPSLSVPGKLPDPTLQLVNQQGTILDENDNWGDSANKQAIIDSGVAPANGFESAIIATLPSNNAQYTAIVRGAGGATGVAVVDVFALQ